MLDRARAVLRTEAEAILALIPRLGGEFEAALNLILACRGRTVLTGIGKSGLVARKISATLASTGTPSFFLHPAEGIHGDLGMVTEADIVIALSNSGETAELLQLLPSLRRIGAKIIALCGSENSTLALAADIFLDVRVEKEACPLGLAPTASTTAALAYGDALAVSLQAVRKFSASDFAIFHPGGTLGRKLLLTVDDVMHKNDDVPLINQDKTVREALFVITDKRLGSVGVVDGGGRMAGILTDGDIRRGLMKKGYEFLDRPVWEMMTATPKTITREKLAAEALHVMESNKPRPITVLPVIDGEKKIVGLLHMTDLVRQGVV
ncbi:MAG: KpsF/GutQ family sugar-phosphate isomerase [Acidaminococcales bacterium]|jgi:arabinose-5-phosphate isomerase|nr:KpsF/GutQ family sugar-phosphate isomerase [Acidaminococcales bacterium]